MAAMTVVEGYAEHVMDAVGDELDPGYAELRRRLDRDRERRGPLDAIVSKLLGLDMKMAQYRRGKALRDEVAERAGIRALNHGLARAPRPCPRTHELDDPDALDRAHRSRREPPAPRCSAAALAVCLDAGSVTVGSEVYKRVFGGIVPNKLRTNKNPINEGL